MSIALPTAILNLRGQVVKGINFDPHTHCLTLRCRRDKRIKAIDSVTGQSGTINRYIRRCIKDIPLCQCICVIEIELAEDASGSIPGHILNNSLKSNRNFINMSGSQVAKLYYAKLATCDLDKLIL